ncbi:MAG: hypothetical protein ACYDHW_07490 [Syntrophorhabdaceae bacterium]
MDETFEVNLLRNVQPTDRKLSVSKEFVGPRNKEERNKRDSSANSGLSTSRKPARLYGKDLSENEDTEEHPGKIDITI